MPSHRAGEATGTAALQAMFMMFDSDWDTVDAYLSPSDTAVADFLSPHITR